MLQEVKPSANNYLQLCRKANVEFAAFLKNPPHNELEIIDWRVNYQPLDEYTIPGEDAINEDILLFKSNYGKSDILFYELMELNDKRNLTERVNIALATYPEINLLHHFLTAVSPKDISSIHVNLIDNALRDSRYLSFYIDSSEFNIDIHELSVPAMSIYVDKSRKSLFHRKSNTNIIGQLILNSEYQRDFISELKKREMIIDVKRVK